MQTEIKIIMPLPQLKSIIASTVSDKIKDFDYNSIDLKLTEKPDLVIITFKQEQLLNA